MQYTTCAPFYLAQPSVEAIEKLFDQKGDDGSTPAERVLGVADHIGRTGERGFTIVELIVVVTVISILSALAAGAYNKVVNDAKLANASALVSTLATAKTAFVTDRRRRRQRFSSLTRLPMRTSPRLRHISESMEFNRPAKMI